MASTHHIHTSGYVRAASQEYATVYLVQVLRHF